MKKELAHHTALGQQARSLQKKLKERETQVADLQSQVDDLSSQLSTAQTEIKALQTKLAAARNAAASVESASSKGPGSAVKNSSANRNASAEAAQAAQLAQLKEDLYSDLTGLIIRSVKKRESDNLYDCIQTGTNGSESTCAIIWLVPCHFLLMAFLQLFISSLQCPTMGTARLPILIAPNSTTCHFSTPIATAIWSIFCPNILLSTLHSRGSMHRSFTRGLWTRSQKSESSLLIDVYMKFGLFWLCSLLVSGAFVVGMMSEGHFWSLHIVFWVLLGGVFFYTGVLWDERSITGRMDVHNSQDYIYNQASLIQWAG